MRICGVCATDVPDEATNCPKCGFHLPREAPDAAPKDEPPARSVPQKHEEIPAFQPPKPPPALELDTSKMRKVLSAEEQAKLDKELARARFRRKFGAKIRVVVLLAVLAGGVYGANVATGGKLFAIAEKQALTYRDELLAKLDPPPPAPEPPPAPAPPPEPEAPKPFIVVVKQPPKKPAAPAAPKVVVTKVVPALAAVNDPRCAPGMVFVPGGMFPFGEKYGGKVLVTVRDFCIDRFEFPNLPGEPPQLVGGLGDAVSTCAQHGKRLCGEEEWEHACKGPDDLAFPYGGAFEPDACNTIDGAGEARETGPAGMFARCLSGYGAADMVGNAAEWTTAAKATGAVAHRKGGAATEVGGCGRATGTGDSVLGGFRCCSDPI